MLRICGALAGLSLVFLLGCVPTPAEHNNLGIAEYGQGEYSEALRAYQLAQVGLPDQPEPYLNAGVAFAQLGEFQNAVAAFNQVLKSFDDELKAKAYYNLGNVYYQQGRFSDAIIAYREALLLQPDDGDTRYNLELAMLQTSFTPPSPDSNNEAEDNLTDDSEITPTPTTQATQSNEILQTPTPVGSMNVEDAEQLLDGVQQNQKPLQDELQTPSSGTPVKGW